MYMYVYVCICMYVYVYVCVCMCMYVYVCVCMCMYVCVCVCTDPVKSKSYAVFGVFFQDKGLPDETSGALLWRILVLILAKNFEVKISYRLRERSKKHVFGPFFINKEK